MRLQLPKAKPNKLKLPGDKSELRAAPPEYETPYRPPMTEKDRTEAFLKLIGEDVAPTPIEKVARFAEKTKPITETLLMPAFKGLQAARGVAGAVAGPKKGIIEGIKSSALKGMHEPEKTPVMGESAAKAYPKAPWQVTGTMGALAEVGTLYGVSKAVQGLKDLATQTLKSLSPSQLASKGTVEYTNKLLKNPKYNEMIQEVSKKSGFSTNEIHLGTQREVLKGLQKTPYLKKLNVALGEAGKAELPKKVAQTTPTLASMGKTALTGLTPGAAAPTTPIERDPVQKVMKALKEAKSVRKETEKLYTKERGRKLGASLKVSQRGERGFYSELGKLKGELPKAEFEAIRGKITQGDIDSLFNKIKDSPLLTDWEKISTRQGFAKLFGEFGGKVPTTSEISMLRKVFGPEFTNVLLDKRDIWKKLGDAAYQLINVPRSIMSSYDLSAPMRQGVFLIGRKPFWTSFGPMFKYFASEKAFDNLQLSIAQNPNYKSMKKGKLALTEMERDLTTREEAYMSGWAEKIPGIGIGIRASGRAYVGFLNKVRSDIFSNLIDAATKLKLDPEDNPDLVKEIAAYVNAATGRGGLGAFQRSAVGLNSIFFSPRLMSSRLTLLNPAYYATRSPFVRKQALRDLFTFAGLGMTILTLAKMAGLEVGLNPTSSDFGKIKIRNTRIDIWGGFQPYIRSAAQLITGKYTSSTTGKEYTLGEGYKPLTRYGILQRQVEGKFSPAMSFATSLLKQQTFTGEPVSVPKEAGLRFVPMVMQDMYDLIKEDPTLLPLAGLGVFGVGVQTYGPRKKKKKGRTDRLRLPD